jgi:uncharacterized membrane protein YoaK (UPF0700 family)
MGGEKVMLSRIIPVDEQSSVAAMMVGAVMAGWGDLEFHVLGMLCVTSLYVGAMKLSGADWNLFQPIKDTY